ncbi:MAG: FG-GAP-like repeat-containing protein [Acidobacteriota bacterium]
MKVRWFIAPLLCVAAAVAVVLLSSSMQKHAMEALRANLMAVSARYPKFTMAQREAVIREWRSEMHPMFRDLSAGEMAQRLLAAAALPAGTSNAPPANFFGNITSINGLGGDILGVERTANCSLTQWSANWMLALPNFTYTMDGPTTSNYDQILHNQAQLKTNGGNWPAGCGDPVTGIPSRQVAYLGRTSAGNKVYAHAFFGGSANYVETVVANGTTDAEVSSQEMTDLPNPLAVVAADLNGDGNPDLVVLSDFLTSGTGSLSVLLGDANGDGGFGSPVNYSLAGETVQSAVIDDFNGDGKLDIAATSTSYASGTTYNLTFLAGKGDGTFASPQNVQLTPPTGSPGEPYSGMVSASLRSNGKKDLITTAGIVLFGNGDGTFTQAAAPGFPGDSGNTQLGPNIVVADFNKDGKPDVALDTGVAIDIYLGKGDGTFTAAGGYATINNTGYLTGADLDGDSNQDLYSGVASAGMFGGDQFDRNEGYALMGNGDGTFQGAPAMPFVFTGTNIMDLNGDRIPDAVGVNSTLNSTNLTMTSYLGRSNGGFTPVQTFTISPVTLSSQQLSFSSLDSFGLGDVTGDGHADLVYIAQGFVAPNGYPGFFLATGKGDGSFNTPAWVQGPSFVPSGGIDYNENLNNLFVADVNGDGKADLIYDYTNQDSKTGTYYQGIAVQLSNGDGTFATPKVIQTYAGTTQPTGNPPVLVQVGRTRPGGNLDLFAETSTTSGSTVTYQVQLYLGNGDGTFGAATTPKVADNPGSPAFGSQVGQIVLADMNGDGKPDLITLGQGGTNSQPEVAISLGNGDGTFQAPSILYFSGGSSVGWGVAAADFDGDGKMDVAVTGFDPPFDTGIFLGNGDGTLQSFKTSTGVNAPAEAIDLTLTGAAASFDFNGDGKPDLAAGSAVLINLGAASTLAPTTTTVTASPPSPVSAGTNVTFTATVSASSMATGTVTFSDGSTALGTATLSNGQATYATNALAVGTHTITATYGGDSTLAGSTSPALAFTVSPQTLPATTSTLTASASTVTSGANVTFTDTVTPAAGGTGTPTGTVTFMNGPTDLGSAPLTNGVASFSTTALPVGADSVTAVYSGDTSFATSTSNAVAVTVSAVQPSFTMAASPASASVTAGTAATTTITVTPAGGFNAAVSFACASQPTGPACTFSPATVTPNGAAATTTLSIGTTNLGAMTLPWRPGSRSGGVTTGAVLAAGVLWVFGRRKNIPWLRMMPLVVILLLIAGAAVGCGGSSGNSSGGGGGGGTSKTYTVTITGTAGSQSQTATFTLTVN